MTEIPLLMSAPLVLQTSYRFKTETRRLRNLHRVNDDPDRWLFTGFKTSGDTLYAYFGDSNLGDPLIVKCPYGMPGDRLWLRENWRVGKGYDGVKPADLPKPGDTGFSIRLWYEADWGSAAPPDAGVLRSSIHMPRWVCRYELEVVNVHVERLRDITEDGAQREGVPRGVWPVTHPKGRLRLHEFAESEHGTYLCGFMYTWVKLNGVESWDLNPWVWVVKYRLCKAGNTIIL